MAVMFSIIVVSLNAGEKLSETAESIRKQTFQDYEVVIKDGGSKDGSLEKFQELLMTYPAEIRDRFHVYREKDGSIYEGMNQAAAKAAGNYFYFLNCGDFFYSEKSLEQAADRINGLQKQNFGVRIYYGDIYDVLRKQVVASNPHMNGFACYRNVPCHQACIYDRQFFAKRGYHTKYRVRADYEHFLYCFYKEKALTAYIPVVLASYEGGGFSETAENRKKSAMEHREITRMYMSTWERFKYRAALVLTLAPLRTKMAESPKMAGFYNQCKNVLYKHR